MLEVEQVTKRYDGKLAVDAASFNARPGRIMGLLGPNGAGKTSILRMVNDITKPDSGAVRLDGRTVGRATQAAIGYMPEERGLYKNVKVIDQLIYLARLKGLSRDAARQSAKGWLETLDAGDWRDRRPRELSRGMQQKVQFALALVHSPRLLILDEPFSGLDPINSALMEQVIRQRKADGAIVIFASHRMEQVEGLCDEICLIANGRIVLDGELDSVKRRFGRDTVSLEFEGDGGFLDRLADAGHVEVLRNADGRAELRIQDGYSASRLLDAARAGSDALHQYAATYPTLREIFIRVVGDAGTEGS
ncbi:MAG: ATP-binding cassette domain-containing protein [Gammaproteobacteria bacterium]|nr:ATP-binding cassette domain-containing protein [Gammaproteobacteria bacterium]